MTGVNSTNEMFPATESLLPYIILDGIAIGICVLAICKTLTFILLIFIRSQLIKEKDKIVFLLSLNMYMSILIFSLILLDMFISMVKGHINSNISQINNDTWWCHFKAYLLTVSMTCSLYSNTFQALHRFFRIICHNRPFLYRNTCPYIIGILIQVFLSTLQPLPILLMGEYEYEDYHCQIPFTNWRSTIIGVFLVWLFPVSITIIIYIYTIHFVVLNSSSFTVQRQTKLQRDLIVIKRILWLIVFLLVCGIPTCLVTIVYCFFGYFGWWANHLGWSAFMLSLIGMSIVQTCFSPHLRVLWSKLPNAITPATAIPLRNLI